MKEESANEGNGPPAEGPIRVALLFPADPAPAQVAELQAVDDRIEVVSCFYMEPNEIRTARTRGDDVEFPEPGELDPKVAEALTGADVVLTLDLPSGMA